MKNRINLSFGAPDNTGPMNEEFVVAVRGDGSVKSEAAEAGKDVYGRDVSKWIPVAGKLKPHP